MAEELKIITDAFAQIYKFIFCLLALHAVNYPSAQYDVFFSVIFSWVEPIYRYAEITFIRRHSYIRIIALTMLFFILLQEVIQRYITAKTFPILGRIKQIAQFYRYIACISSFPFSTPTTRTLHIDTPASAFRKFISIIYSFTNSTRKFICGRERAGFGSVSSSSTVATLSHNNSPLVHSYINNNAIIGGCL